MTFRYDTMYKLDMYYFIQEQHMEVHSFMNWRKKEQHGLMVSSLKIHERFLQVGRTHSQGGYIVFAYHKDVETEQTPQPISLLSWKGSKLKRCTVNTLAAEAQAMVQAVGASYWMRFFCWLRLKD